MKSNLTLAFIYMFIGGLTCACTFVFVFRHDWLWVAVCVFATLSNVSTAILKAQGTK